MPGEAFKKVPDEFITNLADQLGDSVRVSTIVLTSFIITLVQIPCPPEATAASAQKSWHSLDQGKCQDYNNASRVIHERMEKLGYSLPIPIHETEHHSELPDTHRLTTFHILPEDWVKYWMVECPELLCGWNGGPKENVTAFWRAFQSHHPSHEVFSKHAGRLDQVVPLLLHGDEGRAVKRTNYLVLSIESPLGSLDDPTVRCTCCNDLRKRSGLPTYGTDADVLDPEVLAMCRRQTTNFKGHSYLSHFLLFGMGGWIYKRHPHIVDTLLTETMTSLNKLFTEGVSTANGTFYAAIIGIKGDLDFHKKVMCLTRSYSNIGTKVDKELCHLCKAGATNVPFEDYSDSPTWEQTLHLERPWSVDDPPVLANLHYDENCPEEMLQPDLFHITKLGVGRDIVGGILILLLRLKFFDYPESTVNIDDRFSRAHSYFVLWCMSQGKSPGLRSFSKSFFNMKSLISAPWASSKGSDTILLLQWLRHTLKLNIETPAVEGYETLLKQMLQVCEASLSLRMVHHHRLWLERPCAKMLYVHIMTILRGYAVLGKASIRLHIRAFIQKPKHHGLHHIGHFLKRELEKGSSLILSPQSKSCEMNEDFLGRISRLSRRVGFRKCDLRVCHRYFMKIQVLLKRRMGRKNRKVWAKR